MDVGRVDGLIHAWMDGRMQGLADDKDDTNEQRNVNIHCFETYRMHNLNSTFSSMFELRGKICVYTCSLSVCTPSSSKCLYCHYSLFTSEKKK